MIGGVFFGGAKKHRLFDLEASTLKHHNKQSCRAQQIRDTSFKQRDSVPCSYSNVSTTDCILRSYLDESARKASKSKNAKGNPVVLPSKILAVASDSLDGRQIYVAEAAGNVKRIKLEDGSISANFSGPTAPLTSVAVSPESKTIFAGCWDKSVWSWSSTTRRPGRRFQGHSDFVKAVLVFTLQGKEILVSGSADATIIVWDAATGQKIHTLKGHTRGILTLAIDPADYQDNKDSVTLLSAGSDREVRLWRIGLTFASEMEGSEDSPSPIIAHETSIESIYFDSEGDLWTASADKTTKCLSRERNWDEDTKLEHPDFVRDVVVDEDGGWVVTACRDEEVRVWDKSSGKLHHVFVGHFEEVTGLVLLAGQKVVSVSIDNTVRQWSLKAADLTQAIKEAEEEQAGEMKEKVPEKKEGVLTEEEEAELAELMDDSD
ncbi:WD40 repeat-like protein [Pleomassaria siparia CBS 279.74]|uniref:WD40 repeat-like protein n=1 Tax=Pleomassaria siparia CBS 279.74 TaxID=1314801 RepID=A0A6G1KD93_9PLEO|nr:WD40 repeat-like protein [Pleomassaria siparia CBS 279.74]